MDTLEYITFALLLELINKKTMRNTMNLIVAVLMAAVPLTGAFGQKKAKKAEKNAKDDVEMVVIDTVKYTVTYSAKVMRAAVALGQTTSNNPYGDDEMALEIGSRCSHFYSTVDVEMKRQLREMIEKGNINLMGMRRSAIQWHVYKNYPEGKDLYVSPQGDEGYRVEEKTEVPEWTIVSDSTANILGYNCTMATADYKGRKWKAYYTEDIPIDNGPWKLCGLPGLIMKAYDSENHYIFEAIGMKQAEEVKPITYNPRYDKYEKISMNDLTELKRKETTESILAAKGVDASKMIVKVYDADGNEVTDETKKRLKKVSPYNPIER